MTEASSKTYGEFRSIYHKDGTLPISLEVADVNTGAGGHYLHHRLVVGDGRPAAIVVAGDGEALILVRILRQSVGRELWELPRGSSDAADSTAHASDEAVDEYGDEALIRAGLRELREETGYSGSEARVIGRYVADTAVFPQRAGIVRCTVARDAVPRETDGEVEEVRWFTNDELRRMVAAGEIVDSHTLAAIAFLSAS